MTHALKTTNLGHRYGATPALHGVSLEVQPGEIVALLGPSGCGKSTLLRAVAGLITASEGEIALGDAALCRDGCELVPTERRGVGLVFQDYALFPTMRVARNVGFGLRPRDDARVADLLERLGLSDLADRLPASLSGGQQQRVALARALAPRPGVLLLDEPFANLDAGLRDALGGVLRDAVQAEGAAALLVSHDRAEALSLADRVVVMSPGPQGGFVLRAGSPAEVYRDPRSALAAKLTGDGGVVQGEADGGLVRTPFGTVAVEAVASGAVQVFVRPEDAVFTPDAQGPVVVRRCAYLGPKARLHLHHPGAAESLCCDHPDPIPPGTRGKISLLRAARLDS